MTNLSLADEKLRLARPVIDRCVKDPSIEAVCISGSLIADLGTSYSDVDVFAITAPGCRAAERTAEHGVGLDRVEIEFRTREWLDQIQRVAQPFSARIGDNTLRHFPAEQIADAVRIKLGRVAKQSPSMRATRDTLESGSMNLRRTMIALIASSIGDDWMDVLGFLAHDDLESAEIVSRDILEKALDCSSVQEGDLYRGEKWIWSRARRSRYLRDALPWLRELFVGDARGQAMDDQSCYVPRMLAAQKITALAALREWCPQMPDTYVMAPAKFTADGYIRSPHWILVRMAESAVLTDRDVRHYTITDLAVACWAAADGVPRPSLAESARNMVPIASNSEIEAVIDKLEEIGAITAQTEWCR